MKVSTSYLAKEKSNPNAVLIANGVPKWYTGRCCKALAPLWPDVDYYHKTGDNEPLIKNYKNKLNKMGIDVVKSLLHDGDVLVCYEKTGEFCHRHILASWLRDHGVEIERED